MPPEGRALIEERVATMREVLAASGIAEPRISACSPERLGEAVIAMKSAPMFSYRDRQVDRASGKREMLISCIDALRSKYALDPVALAPGSAFGEIAVDRDRCTLCFACVNLCPTSALSGEPAPAPTLRFREASCIQCGMCERACPEEAITLHARFSPDAAARPQARVLSEDELVNCTDCGNPYISRRLLAASAAILNRNPELAAAGLERLMMCPSCRQRSTLMQ